MAHNALIRGGTGSGAWTAIVPTPTDFETFDQRQFESVNGDQGGVWAPATAITIGGSGLTITGNFVVNTATALIEGGVFNCLSSASFDDTTDFFLTVTFHNTAPAIFNGSLTANASATFAAGIAVDASSLFTTGTYTFSASGLVVFNGTTTFNANPTFASVTTTFNNGSITTTGTSVVNLNTTTNIGGTLSIAAVAHFTGSGHVQCRPVYTTAFSGTISLGIADADHFRPTAVTSDTTWNVPDGAPGDSFEVSLVNCSGTHTVTLKRSDTTTIIVMQCSTSSAPEVAKFAWVAGSGWVVFWQMLQSATGI